MHVNLSKAAPLLPSLAIAATLIVYSSFEVNPVIFADVPCTFGGSPLSGKTLTMYSFMALASPPRDGASQAMLIDDSVTLLMAANFGLSKTEKNRMLKNLIK